MAKARRRAATPAERRRALFDQSAVDARVEAASRRLVKLLRQQAGIPIRLPAHHAPPYRAVPWNWGAVGQIEGVNDSLVSRVFRVNFFPIEPTADGGASAGVENPIFGPSSSYICYSSAQAVDIGDATLFPGVPDGFLAWITHADVAAFSVAGANFFLHRYARWSLRVNGNAVPGFQWVQCNSSYQITNLAQLDPGANSPVLPLPCGIALRPGDKVDVAVGIGMSGLAGTMKADFVMRLNGYMIPSKADDGTVYSTLVD